MVGGPDPNPLILVKSVYPGMHCGGTYMPSTVYAKLQKVFSFFRREKKGKGKAPIFKCPDLLTFSYIFYSVFEEDNNLCLILGNSCKDNEILMIFHQVKCELQKKSY